MANWEKFKEIDTKTLLTIFQKSKESELEWQESFLAICFRFKGRLDNHCAIICKKRGLAMDVVHELTDLTFRKYGRTRKFDFDKGNHESIDTCFLCYLFKIAWNEFNNYYKQEQKRIAGKLYEGTEKIITQLPDVDVSNMSPETKIIHDTFMSLSYKHQVIYLTYKQHEREGVNLPKKLREELREHLGVKQPTVRAYKKEANYKMNNCLRIIEKMKL